MSERFVFFYFMKNEPEKIREVVSSHVDYWQKRALEKYEGGAFTDRTGGLITFEAANHNEAAETVNQDPFVTEGLIEAKWVKGWMPEA